MFQHPAPPEPANLRFMESCPSVSTTFLSRHRMFVSSIVVQKWGDYDAFGEPVEPTRFIPMKTPLGQEIIEHWDNDTPPRCPLTLDILVAAQREKGRKLGMIIDLSNHETLYAADLQAYDIIYERVPVMIL